MIALELHDGIERGGAQLLWMLTPRSLAPSAQLTALRFAARRLSSPADPVAAISRAARRSSNREPWRVLYRWAAREWRRLTSMRKSRLWTLATRCSA